jgi:hypothetical protein
MNASPTAPSRVTNNFAQQKKRVFDAAADELKSPSSAAALFSTSSSKAPRLQFRAPSSDNLLVRSTTVHDSIHGDMAFQPLLVAIIDTPEFQRLRGLKQLGVCNRVYPTAIHTRFEHSLGVAHMAESLALQLMRNQPELDMTVKDCLCIKIAGKPISSSSSYSSYSSPPSLSALN